MRVERPDDPTATWGGAPAAESHSPVHERGVPPWISRASTQKGHLLASHGDGSDVGMLVASTRPWRVRKPGQNGIQTLQPIDRKEQDPGLLGAVVVYPQPADLAASG